MTTICGEIYDELSTKVPEIMQRWIDPITGKAHAVHRAAAGHIAIGTAVGARRTADWRYPVNDAPVR